MRGTSARSPTATGSPVRSGTASWGLAIWPTFKARIGQVIESVNAETQRAVYLAWCRAHDVPIRTDPRLTGA